FPLVHAVNLLLFLFALACFDFCWRTWLEDHLAYNASGDGSGMLCLPPGALLAIVYGLFTWSAVGLIGVQLISPDLLVAALVYLAAGLTLQLRRSAPRPLTAALLGLVLGLGFLAKAVMLPLAGVSLLVAFLPARD